MDLKGLLPDNVAEMWRNFMYSKIRRLEFLGPCTIPVRALVLDTWLWIP